MSELRTRMSTPFMGESRALFCSHQGSYHVFHHSLIYNNSIINSLFFSPRIENTFTSSSCSSRSNVFDYAQGKCNFNSSPFQFHSLSPQPSSVLPFATLCWTTEVNTCSSSSCPSHSQLPVLIISGRSHSSIRLTGSAVRPRTMKTFTLNPSV